MSADSFRLTVVTPVGVALDERVTSVTLPTVEGEIGVLPGHVDYNGLLGVGIISYTAAGSPDTQRAVVSGGFIQFGNETLTVLADNIDTSTTVDKAKYGSNRAELESIVNTEDTHSARWQVARDQLSRIESIDRLIAA